MKLFYYVVLRTISLSLLLCIHLTIVAVIFNQKCARRWQKYVFFGKIQRYYDAASSFVTRYVTKEATTTRRRLNLHKMRLRLDVPA
jgi:hypothetical protein